MKSVEFNFLKVKKL